jgi:hypothetical protein
VPETNRELLEQLTRGWLARFARLLLWEPIESLRSFVEVLTPCIVNKMEPELARALRKGRVEDLGKRAYRWLERSFWEDISRYPDDPLDKRTLRLKKLLDSTQTIPKRQGDSEYFPISIFIEYDSLLGALKPAFKRRPARLSRKQANLPDDDPQSRDSRRENPRWRLLEDLALSVLHKKHLQRWETGQLQRANQVISVPEWPKDQEFSFEAGDVMKLTARTAALRILEAKMNLSNEAVWKLVKEGRKLLPLNVRQRLKQGDANVTDNSTWQFLNRAYPLE